jgi:hypothetical protein
MLERKINEEDLDFDMTGFGNNIMMSADKAKDEKEYKEKNEFKKSFSSNNKLKNKNKKSDISNIKTKKISLGGISENIIEEGEGSDKNSNYGENFGEDEIDEYQTLKQSTKEKGPNIFIIMNFLDERNSKYIIF